MNDYDYLFKILVIGNAGVGKTNILMRYIDDSFDMSYMSTIGVDFKIKTVKVDDVVVKLQIWDTAGQERFRTITSSYYRGAHAVLIVFDVCDTTSFTNLNYWMTSIQNQNGMNLTRLLIGNKTDLIDNRVISYTQASELADHYDIPYIETSAKNNNNIEKVFVDLAKTLIRQHPTVVSPTPLLPATTVPAINGCLC